MTAIDCDMGRGFGIWRLDGDENTVPPVPSARAPLFRTEIED